VKIAVSFKLTAIEKLNLLRRFDISDDLKEYSERPLMPPLLHKLIFVNKLSR
jgi:glutaredoxin-related protein